MRLQQIMLIMGLRVLLTLVFLVTVPCPPGGGRAKAPYPYNVICFLKHSSFIFFRL